MAAVGPIMNAEVAAATRMGIPQKEFRTGTWMTPPPTPSRPEMAPAIRDTPMARGRRFMR